MITLFILLYLALTLSIGVYAARRVKSSGDFLLAGKRLPLYLDTATVFATWFGSESLLGASSQMSEEGILGVIEDPFGAALCLLLVGLFFAKPLYRMNLITFGDFYRIKFNRSTEIIASILLTVSYFGWVAAQMLALGIILNVILGTGIPTGIIIGSCIVIVYTFLGGMWSVALTDLLQSIVIISGLIFVTLEITGKTAISNILEQTPSSFFEFVPHGKGTTTWLNYFASWITIGLGSIAGQDVFQRVMSAKSEKVAMRSSVLASLLYLTVVMMPMLLALYARVLYPELLSRDSQLLIPNLVLQHSNSLVIILFFGALISAIMSTASGATLAPAAILSENLLKPLFKNLTDTKFLLLSRLCVIVVAALSMFFAFSNDSIFELVGLSSQMTLVTIFVPLVAALFFKSGNSSAAIVSMLAGLSAWLFALYIKTDINPLLYGFGASISGFVFAGIVIRKN